MSIDELPEEQLDHVLRFALCDSERQGDGETPRTWLQVPAVRLVCQHWAATHRQDQVLSPVGEALGHLQHASWLASERDRREVACLLEALVITPVVGRAVAAAASARHWLCATCGSSGWDPEEEEEDEFATVPQHCLHCGGPFAPDESAFGDSSAYGGPSSEDELTEWLRGDGWYDDAARYIPFTRATRAYVYGQCPWRGWGVYVAWQR
jgi:hypothetical protein